MPTNMQKLVLSQPPVLELDQDVALSFFWSGLENSPL